MDKLSLSQQYVVYVTRSNGRFPRLNEAETEVGMIHAALWDLQEAAAIDMTAGRVWVCNEPPEELLFLKRLVEDLSRRPITVKQIIEAYVYSWSRKRVFGLWEDISESLVLAGAAEARIGGSWGRKVVYLPNPKDQKTLQEQIRRRMSGTEEMDGKSAALIEILNQSGNLERCTERG